MKSVRRSGTACEVAVRKAVHARGLRYRVDAPLPFDRRRRADLLFSKARVAVFVDGCFWHGCPIHATRPRANATWWREKLDANRRRDRRTDALALEHGWVTLRIWEHEDPEEAARRVEAVVRRRTSGRKRS